MWLPFVVVLVLALGYVYLKRSGQISRRKASELIKHGAMVIDVRSSTEYANGHILQAYNMPLDRIDVMISSAVKDKNKPLLLHCTSGIRSNLARRKLSGLGYSNVHNMGSFNRAEKIVSQG